MNKFSSMDKIFVRQRGSPRVESINIRYFKAQDAEICFKIRSAAFIQKFYSELGARATSAGVNAFMPNDYVVMAQATPFFVAEDFSGIIGLFTIERKDSCYIKIVDVKRLTHESTEDYNAIIILNKCMAGRPDPRVESFIDNAPEKEKIIVLTTGKLDSWKPDSPQVDAKTSASDNIFDRIRRSCRKVADRATRIRINYSRISSYAASLPVEKIIKPQLDPDCHYLGQKEATVSFLITLNSINFGSGYFPHLRKRAGMSGYFTIAYLLNAAYQKRNGSSRTGNSVAGA